MDTSALVKRYASGETGHLWTRSQCQPGKHNTIMLSQATLVEAVASICRKAREPDPTLRITYEERDRLITIFRKDRRKPYYVVRVTESLYTKAGDLCCFHQLRSYDAIQLACALEVRTKQIKSGLEAPIFVSADNKLLDIASYGRLCGRQSQRPSIATGKNVQEERRRGRRPSHRSSASGECVRLMAGDKLAINRTHSPLRTPQARGANKQNGFSIPSPLLSSRE